MLFGNTCLAGLAGSRLSLFVKDESGEYRQQLGFPAGGYRVLGRGIGGFPDLEIGGPGFCFGIWRWTGSAYDFRCNQPQEPGGCDEIGHICPDP